MYKVCKNCGKQYDLSVKKCPECGGKLKEQFTEAELEEIKKQNDDFTAISTFMFQFPMTKPDRTYSDNYEV